MLAAPKDIIYMWNLKKPDLEEWSRAVATRGWGWRKWGDTGQRAQTSSYKMNKF